MLLTLNYTKNIQFIKNFIKITYKSIYFELLKNQLYTIRNLFNVIRKNLIISSSFLAIIKLFILFNPKINLLILCIITIISYKTKIYTKVEKITTKYLQKNLSKTVYINRVTSIKRKLKMLKISDKRQYIKIKKNTIKNQILLEIIIRFIQLNLFIRMEPILYRISYTIIIWLLILNKFIIIISIITIIVNISRILSRLNLQKEENFNYIINQISKKFNYKLEKKLLKKKKCININKIKKKYKKFKKINELHIKNLLIIEKEKTKYSIKATKNNAIIILCVILQFINEKSYTNIKKIFKDSQENIELFIIINLDFLIPLIKDNLKTKHLKYQITKKNSADSSQKPELKFKKKIIYKICKK